MCLTMPWSRRDELVVSESDDSASDTDGADDQPDPPDSTSDAQPVGDTTALIPPSDIASAPSENED